MKDRLRQIIEYKTGGRQTEFATLLGWTPPYLSKLLKGVDFGIRPVISILETLPEIDARWFLLGTGDMLTDARRNRLHAALQDNVFELLDLEKFIPVMTADELRLFETAVLKGVRPAFSRDTLTEWRRLLREKEQKTDERFAAAQDKSK
ncbi:MAG: hypothetical protein MJY71_02635 [Bacteroidaceae bacterium]|nr:hypothetical protein [Bacteroidaceae bacterium]